MKLSRVCLCAAVLLFSPIARSVDSGTVYFEGGPNDFLTRGNVLYGPSTGFNGQDPTRVLINTALPQFLTAQFQAPYGSDLAAGDYERAGGQALDPSLSVGADGRGCELTDGWFRVLEIGHAADGSINRFAADLTGECQELQPTPFYGVVRFNSAIPVTLAGPFARPGPAQYAPEGTSVMLDGSRSFELSSSPLQYAWTQVSGPPVELSGATTALPTFVAPTGLPLGGVTLVFRLDVTDSTGATDHATTSVVVPSKSDPLNFITLSGALAVELASEFDPSNTRLVPFGTAGQFLSFNLWRSFYPLASLTLGVTGAPLQVGTYQTTGQLDAPAGQPVLNLQGSLYCSAQVGSLTIAEIAYDSDGKPTRLAATFSISCQDSVSPGATAAGMICYQCIDARVPVANAGPAQSAASGSIVLLDARGSRDPLGGTLAYQWRQTAGAPVTLSDPSSATPTFTLPPASYSQVYAFTLTVTNAQNYMATSQTSVSVAPAAGGGAGGWPSLVLLTAGLLFRGRRSHSRVLDRA